MQTHSGAATQITRKGGVSFCFSVDGQTLYYMKDRSNAGQLWAVPADGGEERFIANKVQHRGFGATKAGIYFISPQWSINSALKFLSFATGSIGNVFEFPRPIVPGFSLSTDGKHAYFAQVDVSQSDLILVEDFH